MWIKLYHNSAPPNKINKAGNLSKATDQIGLRFTEKNTLDILHPSILIEFSGDISDIKDYNYMYISEISRYYYIDSLSTEGGLIRINGRCDVLMSHKADILASTQYIVRSESLQNKYVVDPLLPFTSQKKYFVRQYGNPVYDEMCNCVILETIGKGVS